MKTKIANSKILSTIFNFLLLCFGCVLIGIAYNCFYLPHNFTPNGITGLSTIISHLITGSGAWTSIIYLIINVLLLLLAVKFMGLKFTLLTLIGTGIFTLSIEYISIPALTPTNEVVSAFIGGAFAGIGTGIIFRSGGNTGGSDIIVWLVNKFFPKIKAGQCLFVINLTVVVLSAIVFGINEAFCTIIAIFVAGKMVDVVLDGSKGVRAFYIICDKDVEVAEKILQTFHRGVTRIDAEGAFSHKKKTMLLCLVTNEQANAMKAIVKEADPNSFMYSTSVREALGETMFIREVSKRKHQLLRAKADIKSDQKLSRSNIKRLSPRNKLKFVRRRKLHSDKSNKGS